MSKDTMISFRTTEEFSKSLKKYAKKNKVTLSGFIDAVLQDFLQSQAGQDILLQDRRRFPRQHKAIPAIISGHNGSHKYFHASKITNLSLGGINLVVPKKRQQQRSGRQGTGKLRCRVRPAAGGSPHHHPMPGQAGFSDLRLLSGWRQFRRHRPRQLPGIAELSLLSLGGTQSWRPGTPWCSGAVFLVDRVDAVDGMDWVDRVGQFSSHLRRCVVSSCHLGLKRRSRKRA